MLIGRQRRTWIPFLSLLLLTALLTACAGGKGKTTPPIGPSAGQPLSGETAVTITFACSDHERVGFEKLAEEFHELHPEIKVQLVSVEETMKSDSDGPPEDAVAKQAAIADTAGVVAGCKDMGAGWFLDLQPFIQADRIFDTDDFYPGTLEAYQWAGGQWVVPAQVGFHLIRYDKDAFDQAGVDYPQIGWTWDDFLDAAKRLTRREEGQVTHYGFADVGRTALLPTILSQAGALLDETVEPPMPLLDTPEVAEAVQWYADLALVHGVMPPLSEGSAEQAAMWLGSSLDSYWSLEERNLGVVSFPRGKVAVGPMWVQGYAMSAGTQHPAESWRWLAFLTRRPSPGLGMGEALPARRSLAEEIGFWEKLDEDLAAVCRDALEHPSPWNRMFDVYEPLAEAAEAVLEGQRDVETALAEAQARAVASLTSDSVATPVAVATPKPEASSGEGVTIRFMSAGMFEDHYRSLADKFHRLHPDITVQFIQKPFDRQITMKDVATLADCSDGWPGQASPETRAHILNLQPFLEGDEDFPLDDFYPQALSAFQWEGELWGLPSEGGVYLVAYNKSLFDAVGVPYPRADWTLDDFVHISQALTAGEGDDKQYGFVPFSGETSDLLFMVEQQAGELVDHDANPPRIRFDDPMVVAAVQWYADLALVHGVKPAHPIDYGQQRISGAQERLTLITSGRAAMWTTPSSFLERARHDVFPEDFQLGVAPLPLQLGGGGYRQIWFSGYWVSAEAAHPEACWEWLVFLTGHPGVDEGLPARRSVAESEAFRQQVGKELATAHLFAIAHQDSDAPSLGDSTRQWVDMYWFYAAYDRIIAGEDAETALAWAQEMTEAHLACVISRKDQEGQDVYHTCATEVDQDYSVWYK